MSKNTSLLLILWNAVLTALLGWTLLRKPTVADVHADAALETFAHERPMYFEPDTAPRPGARIAYFLMDSVRQGFVMVKEQSERLKGEGRRLESQLQSEMAKAQARYQELMTKDHTYSTQAEREKDEQELQGLAAKLQALQASSEERLARMEVEILGRIAGEIEDFLTDYNDTAKYDYIFSVQDGGQIWTGNPALDITADVVGGLNARHKAKNQGK
jgi:Skp family chaperone for outer membrane proteins